MNLSVPQKAPLTALVNRVVSKLRRDILNGTYKEGDRLPPFRKLADEFGVSIFTIHRALKELAVENLVSTREGATTLVGKVDPSLLSEVATSDAVSESAKLPEAVRWIRQDSSLRKLRLSILQKTFESSGEWAVKRVNWRDEWSNLPAEAFQNEIFRSFLSAAEPTCAVFNRTQLPTLDGFHCLADIATLLDDADREKLLFFLQELKPEVLQEVSPSANGGGRFLMLPTTISLGTVLYDRQKLASAGLPDRAPKSWQEFLDVLTALSRAHGKPPLVVNDIRAMGWLLAQFCHQLATPLSVATKSLDGIDYASEKISPALDFVFKLLLNRSLVEVGGDTSAEFAFSRLLSGEIPVFISPSSVAAQLADFGNADRFLLAPVPTPDGKPAVNLMNVAGWTVNAHAPIEAQRGAAAQLLAYVTWMHSLEGGAQMKRLAIARSIYSVFINPAKDGSCQRPLPESWMQVIAEAESTACWEPVGATLEHAAIGERLLRMLQAGDKTELTIDLLREECRIAQRHAQGINPPANEKDAVLTAFA